MAFVRRTLLASAVAFLLLTIGSGALAAEGQPNPDTANQPQQVQQKPKPHSEQAYSLKQITVLFADFTTITRSRTMAEATDVTQEISREAVRSYDALSL